MGYFLLLLLIFFIVIPLGKAIYSVYKLKKQTRQFFERMHRDMTGAEPPEDRSGNNGGFSFGFGRNSRSSSGSPKKPQARKKKIPSDIGEYVAFEERTLTREEINDIYASAGSRKNAFPTENQISDIDWEEIQN